MGSGSNLTECASPNTTTLGQIAGPTEITYDTSALNPLCSTTVQFDISDISSPVLVQVNRGLAYAELEYELYMTTTPTNTTGQQCTIIGTLMTCQQICAGALCNGAVAQTSLQSFQDDIQMNCIDCNAVAPNSDNQNAVVNGLPYSTYWEQCLAGTNTTQTKNCQANGNNVGQNTLSNMCVTLINYANDTGTPVSIYRGCGIPVGSAAINFPTKGIEYSTLGQCGPEGATSVDGNPTTSCVQAFLQDFWMDSDNDMVQYIPNQKAAPGPSNATCYQCYAMAGDYAFEACLSPNSTNAMDYGVGETVCDCGVTTCSVATLFDSTGEEVLGVQRGCMSALKANVETNQCSYTDAADTAASNVLCVSQCTAGEMPCNDMNNNFTSTTPISGSAAFSASLLLLAIVSMIM